MYLSHLYRSILSYRITIFLLGFFHCSTQTSYFLEQDKSPSAFQSEGLGSFIFGMQLSKVVQNPDCKNYQQSQENRFIWTCQKFTKLDGKPRSLRFTFSNSDLIQIEIILAQTNQELTDKEIALWLSTMRIHFIHPFLTKKEFREVWNPQQKDRHLYLRFPWGSEQGHPEHSLLSSLQKGPLPRMELFLLPDISSQSTKQAGGFIEKTSSGIIEMGLFFRNVPPQHPIEISNHQVDSLSPTSISMIKPFWFGMKQNQISSFCKNLTIQLSNIFSIDGTEIITPQTDDNLQNRVAKATELQCKDYPWRPHIFSTIFLTLSHQCRLCSNPSEILEPTEPGLQHLKVVIPFPQNSATSWDIIQQELSFFQKQGDTLLNAKELSWLLPSFYFPELNPGKIRTLLQLPPAFLLQFASHRTLALKPGLLEIQFEASPPNN